MEFQLQIEIILRLGLAAFLGAMVGWERERAKKPAGLRTHTLICLGACLFTIASIYGFEVNNPGIAAGVVTGIGFLGAGAIFQRGEGFVEGLTTAATIWAVAAVGLAVGAGMYIVAAVSAVLVLIVLVLPHRIKG